MNDDFKPSEYQCSPLTLNESVKNAKLLIVDDEPANVELLEDLLRESNYEQIRITTDPYAVLPLCREFLPDLILLDLMMPGLDGMTIMGLLRDEPDAWAKVPILVLTADISSETKLQALAQGAKDFLGKPFDAVELLLRLHNLLETRCLYQDIERQNVSLEDRVKARTAELELAREELAEAQIETLERLALAGEYRDDDTGQHTQRVARVTALLSEKMGFAAERVRWIQQAARLHDVGKIGISDTILLKPGKLTDEEFTIMKSHAVIGATLFASGKSEVIQIAQRIAHCHHERWDGSGYPQGLGGEDIPIEGRLLSVADVFDALTHERPYKKAWPVSEAVGEIDRQRGNQFDPEVVSIFMCLAHEELV